MTIFLETERLVLKVPMLSDLDNWYEVYTESDDSQISREAVLEWLGHHIRDFAKLGFGMGSVFLKHNNEFIGRAGLFNVYDQSLVLSDIEIGYVIIKKHRNKGYATELVNALIDWGFKNLNVDKLFAYTRFDNTRSQHILEKVGMRYVKNTRCDHQVFQVYEIYKTDRIKQ